VNTRGLLFTWAEEDDKISQAIADAKEQIFTKLAQNQFLDALGSNVGVFRPTTFNLLDEQYRELIPTLSFFPKQVVPTIKKVLDIFFGVGNPIVKVNEINGNEIVIQIPSSVPGLRRDLEGSHHFHAYNGTIVSVDNIFKEIVIDLTNADKNLVIDELANGSFGQEQFDEIIASNTAGNTSVTLQFFASADLSVFTTTETFNMIRREYPGSFFPDTTSAFTMTLQRGVLGQAITAGSIVPTLTMTDASNIPDQTGFLVFNSGRNTEESLVKYFGRPNNTTLLLDPVFTFGFDHAIGEPVNVIQTPYIAPNVNGSDFSIYLVGVTAARILAQQIIQSIVAAGIIIRFIVIEPEC